MRTTIDGAGRIVIPKALRDALGLAAGRQVDVTFADGRLEIEVVPAEVAIDTPDGEIPRIIHSPDTPPLTDEMIRAAIDETRR